MRARLVSVILVEALFVSRQPTLPNLKMLDRSLVAGEVIRHCRLMIVVNKMDLEITPSPKRFAPPTKNGLHTVLYANLLDDLGVDEVKNYY